MTLIEMAIVVILVSFGLFLLMGWSDALREDAKRDLAIRVLADLDHALLRYHRETGFYPTSRGPSSAIQATLDLLDHDRTRPILETIPASLWRGPGRRPLADPWGTPLRYYGPDSGSRYVEANNGQPVFVSAGPDRGFGAKNAAELGDNLRRDDPGPSGFRLFHVAREVLSDKEPHDGQEDDRSDTGGEQASPDAR